MGEDYSSAELRELASALLAAAAKALADKRGGQVKSVGWTAWTDDEWAVALAGYARDGSWLDGVPKPGEAGCPAPAHLMREAA